MAGKHAKTGPKVSPTVIIERISIADFQKCAFVVFDQGSVATECPRDVDNDLLGLPEEDLDEAAAIAVRMGENSEVIGGHH